MPSCPPQSLPMARTRQLGPGQLPLGTRYPAAWMGHIGGHAISESQQMRAQRDWWFQMKTRDCDFIFSLQDAGAEIQRDASERPIFLHGFKKKPTNHGGATFRGKPGLARPCDPLHASSCSSLSPTSITGTGQRRANALREQSSVILQWAGLTKPPIPPCS